jgi:hypothetical protein
VFLKRLFEKYQAKHFCKNNIDASKWFFLAVFFHLTLFGRIVHYPTIKGQMVVV